MAALRAIRELYAHSSTDLSWQVFVCPEQWYPGHIRCCHCCAVSKCLANVTRIPQYSFLTTAISISSRQAMAPRDDKPEIKFNDAPGMPDPAFYSHAVSLSQTSRLVFTSGIIAQHPDGSFP